VAFVSSPRSSASDLISQYSPHPRAAACTTRYSTCMTPRASAWAPRLSTCDAQRAAPAPGHRDQTQKPTPGHVPRSVCVWGPSLLAVFALTLFRCAYSELLFSCCESVAAPRETDWAPRSSTSSTTSGAASNVLGSTAKYLQQTTGGGAGNGLGATIKYLRRTTSSAANNGLGTTIKYFTARAAGNGLDTAIEYLRLTRRQPPGYHDQVLATYN